jgi:hypothetical protein
MNGVVQIKVKTIQERDTYRRCDILTLIELTPAKEPLYASYSARCGTEAHPSRDDREVSWKSSIFKPAIEVQ